MNPRVEKVGHNIYSVDGTPTDCINLAINGILPERPDIVVSGINKGGNLGDDVTYSGTVSAAMEGTLMGIPSIAVSLVGHDNFDFKYAARFASKLVKYVISHNLPKDTLLNVNVPGLNNSEIKSYRITKLGKRVYGDAIVEKTDPRGKKYYLVGVNNMKWTGGKDSDFEAIANGYISITPIHLDLTNYSALKEIHSWKF